MTGDKEFNSTVSRETLVLRNNDIFDPNGGRWTPTLAPGSTGWGVRSLTLLPDDRVLALGATSQIYASFVPER